MVKDILILEELCSHRKFALIAEFVGELLWGYRLAFFIILLRKWLSFQLNVIFLLSCINCLLTLLTITYYIKKYKLI